MIKFFLLQIVTSKGTDRGAFVVYWLSSVLKARYLKLEVSVGAHERACLQFEIIGCDGGKQNFTIFVSKSVVGLDLQVL